MLDSAIEAYEAHREALQRLAVTLDVFPSSSSASPPTLSNLEKKKLSSEIHSVLDAHPLRFAHVTPNFHQRNDFTAPVMAQRGSESYPSGSHNREAVYANEKSNYIASREMASTNRLSSDPVIPQPFSSETVGRKTTFRSSGTNALHYEQRRLPHAYEKRTIYSSSSQWDPSAGHLSPLRRVEEREGRGGEGRGSVYDGHRGQESERRNYTVGSAREGGVGGTFALRSGDGREGVEVYPTTTTPQRLNPSTNFTSSPLGGLSTSHPPSFSAGLGGPNATSTPLRTSQPHKVGISLTPWPLPVNTGDSPIAMPSSSAGVDRRNNTSTLADQYDAHKRGISPSTRWEGTTHSRSPSRSTGGGAGGESPYKMAEENRFNTLRSRPQEISRSSVTPSFRDPNHSRAETSTSSSPAYRQDVYRRPDPASYKDFEGKRDGESSLLHYQENESARRIEERENKWASTRQKAAAPTSASAGMTREQDVREREMDSWRHARVHASTPEPLFYRTPFDNEGAGRELSPSYPQSVRVPAPRRSPYCADMYGPSKSVLRESSPAAIRYMHQEDEDLQQRKEAAERLLHSMAPGTVEKTPGREVETAILYQLQREQLLLENQLNRMQMERDFLLQRNPKDNGSEPRYSQLNHRIGKVSADLNRVDREIQVVKGLETADK